MRTAAVRQPATHDWTAAWTEALDDLELDLDRAEELLTVGRTGSAGGLHPAPAAWVAPDLPGPIPENLRARAQAVYDRQLRVSEDLARGLAAGRRELALASLMESAAKVDHSRPAFLDTTY